MAEEENLMTSAYYTVPEVFTLKKVRLRNTSGGETDEFNTYDNITIAFEMEFSKKIENVQLAFNIRDQVNDMVISSSKLQWNASPCKGIVKAECEIEKNKLREGNYNLGFYVSDYDGGALFKSNAVGSFTILADMEIIRKSDSTRGIMIMDTKWKVL